MDRHMELRIPSKKNERADARKRNERRQLPHARPETYYKNRLRQRALAAAAVVLSVVTLGGLAIEASKKRPIPNADQVYDGVVKISKEHTNKNGELIELNLRTSPEIPEGSNRGAFDNTIDWPFQNDVIYVTNPKIVKEYESERPWVEMSLPSGEEIYASWTAATSGLVGAVEFGDFINGKENSDGGFTTTSGDAFKPNELSIITFKPPSAQPSK